MNDKPHEHAAEKGIDRLLADLRDLDRKERETSLAAMRSIVLCIVGLDALLRERA